MATLEKIRSKSVLLLIVIGVALLAFIIGDFVKSSTTIFGKDTSVAKIDGEKIEAPEYQKQREAASRNGSGNTEEERTFLDMQVLNNMVMERLQKEEYEKLGLTVTDEELNDAIFGAGAVFGNMLAAQFTNGQMNAAQLRDFCDNPAKYGNEQADAVQLRQTWLTFEESLASQLLDYKFMNMLDGTMTANKLDVAQMYNDNNTGYAISYVQKPFTNDPNIKVTDDEVNKLWEADKANYALDEETRLVGMIAVPIVPSTEDEESARAMVSDVLQALNTTPELEGLRGRKGFNNDRTTMTLSAISEMVKRGGNAKLKAIADSASVGTAALIQDGPTDFLIAKILGRNVEVDSLTFNVVLVATEDAAMADSVKAGIAAGKNAADLKELGALYALDSVNASISNPMIMDSQIGQIVGQDLQSFKSQFLAAELGQMFSPDTVNAQGYARYYTVTNRKAPESNVNLALVSYTLTPSNATILDLRSRLEDYISKNNTADKFAQNAAAANYQFDYNYISASNPYVIIGQNQQGPVFLPNSYNASVWALDAEKGAVSGVFGDERTGAFLVVAVKDIFTDYCTTADPSVKDKLTRKALESKNADAMIKQYSGKATNLEGYANVMGGEVATDVVNFVNSVRIYGPELLSKIVTTGKGTLVGPQKGQTGVVVFQVNEVNGPVRPMNMDTDAAAFSQRRGAGLFSSQNGAQTLLRMLLGKRQFENRLVKVYGNN